MAKVLTALFPTPAAASVAINSLHAIGVPQSDISLVASDRIDRGAFTVGGHTVIAKGARVRAVAGGVISSIVGDLTPAGTLATAGTRLVIAGPLLAALKKDDAVSAAGAGLGAIAGLAIPDDELKQYEDALEQGSVLVGVDYDDPERRDTINEICGIVKRAFDRHFITDGPPPGQQPRLRLSGAHEAAALD